MQVCPYDVTYCAYKDCPFKDCESHLVHTKGFPIGTMVSVADYSGVCRRYIGFLVDEVSSGEMKGEKHGSVQRKRK